MSSIDYELCRLAQYGIDSGLMEESDRFYALNRMLALLPLNDLSPQRVPEENLRTPTPILENILDLATEAGLLPPDSISARDQLDTELMACLMPRPSQVNTRFYELMFQNGSEAATDYYYSISRKSNYIRVDRIEKDEKWDYASPYGSLTVTINLSKPEKDPRAISEARKAAPSGYPKCALCRENEGFLGDFSRAARGNHRLINLSLGGERWFLQYSPYVYYNEHCILLNAEHTPMTVSKRSIGKLLEFVSQFPHYFAGSNADLPIVGGSILSHDHFQGGHYELPMAKAQIREKVLFAGFEDIEAGILNWPMSVVRLIGKEPDRLCDLSDRILSCWREYSDPSAEILAFSEEAPHNTVTPICRFRNGCFETDLVLRNNRTTPEHPLGLFHPHAEYHHIKKENIGLIEAMGLAILPARLKTELRLLEDCLAGDSSEEETFGREEMKKHAEWYEALKARALPREALSAAIREDIGAIFTKILENAGVYKNDAAGNAAFARFLSALGARIG